MKQHHRKAEDTTDASAYSGGAAYIDGRFVPIGEARIPILDWGFVHSDATYDVAHVWHGRFFRLEDHLDRFERGMAKLHMRLPHSRDGIREALVECVRRSGLRNAYVEMICTRGISPAGSRDPRTCSNRFYAFAVPFVWIADPDQRATGLHAKISSVQRIAAASVDPTIKNYHWLDFVSGLYEAYAHGAETTILVDRDGNVSEGPGFNVFAVKHGQLTTPVQGVLEGITRQTVIDIAAELGLPLSRRALPAGELRAADEVFATSTAGGVMPLTRIDEEWVGDGNIGPVTTAIHDTYWQWHADSRFTLPIPYG